MSDRKVCGEAEGNHGNDVCLRTEDFERFAVPCRPVCSSNVSRRKVPFWLVSCRRSVVLNCLPGVGDDDVVEGRVALAEAREPYLEDHDCVGIGARTIAGITGYCRRATRPS